MSERNMTKDEWGPRRWNRLHTMAIFYPLRYKITDILRDIDTLPCPECHYEATNYIRHNRPDLSSSYSLQIWMWRFHNAVNARTGKKQFSFQDYLNKYSDEITISNMLQV